MTDLIWTPEGGDPVRVRREYALDAGWPVTYVYDVGCLTPAEMARLGTLLRDREMREAGEPFGAQGWASEQAESGALREATDDDAT